MQEKIKNRLDSLLQTHDCLADELKKYTELYYKLIPEVEKDEVAKELYGVIHYIEILTNEIKAYGNKIAECYIMLKLDNVKLEDELLKKLENITRASAPSTVVFEGKVMSGDKNIYETIQVRTQSIPDNIIDIFKKSIKEQIQK